MRENSEFGPIHEHPMTIRTSFAMPTREYFVGDAACMNIKLTMLRVSARIPLRRSGNDTRQTWDV